MIPYYFLYNCLLQYPQVSGYVIQTTKKLYTSLKQLDYKFEYFEKKIKKNPRIVYLKEAKKKIY